jgi:hypothetical protein
LQSSNIQIKHQLITTAFMVIFKSRLKSTNGCYHSVQNLLFPVSFQKHKIKIYITTISHLHVCCMPNPFHPLWFNHCNTKLTAYIMNFPFTIMDFFNLIPQFGKSLTPFATFMWNIEHITHFSIEDLVFMKDHLHQLFIHSGQRTCRVERQATTLLHLITYMKSIQTL